MPRSARAAVGGLVYHVLNRGNNRQRIFRKPADFDAFVRLLIDGRRHADVEVLAYCLMDNHFHLAVIPRRDMDLARYLSWVTNTHVKRYRSHYRSTSGHLYQGRFRSFPVQEESHFLVLCRYVEANAKRAGLVEAAQEWRWGSLWQRRHGDAGPALSEWPVQRPPGWTAMVNEVMARGQLDGLRTSVNRGRPFGEAAWVEKTARRLGLQFTLRQPGRPRKEQK